MPSWKKVVTFGSDAQLNSLNVTTYVSASEFRGPLAGTASFAASSSYAVTASYAENSPLATTASYAISASYASFATTASHALTASSADNFLVRGSLTGSSAAFNGNITASNLLVNNTITAQTLVVQVITSSTEFVTGSTIFGSQLTDTHQFTGSVTITGSLSLNGDPIVVSSSYYPFSQSVQIRLTDLESTSSVLTSASASFAQDSGSNSVRLTNVESTSSVLTSASSSFSTRVTTLENASASFAQDSGSNSVRFTNLESTSSALVQASASFDTRILNNSSSIATLSSSYLASSASFDTRINDISGSYVTTASYLLDSASFDTRILNNSSSTAVLSSSFLVASGSFSTRVTDLELFSSSLDANFVTEAELAAATASLSASIAYLSSSYLNSSTSFDTRILNNSSSIASLSSSFLLFSGSYNTGSFTGSFSGSLFGTASWAVSASHAPSSLTASYAVSASYSTDALSSSYALTASYAANVPETASYALFALSASYASQSSVATTALTASSADNFVVRQDLTGSNALFTGTITAQTLNVQVITSSVEYVTGSTIFGSQLTDTHQFTGSVSITGSLSVNNSPVITSDQTGSLTVLSSSYATTSSYSFNSVSSSYALTASYAANVPATASYALQALSSSYSDTSSLSNTASYAVTAAYALNAGGAGISAIYIADEGVLQGTSSYFDFTGAGVTATIVNGTASINITGGGGAGSGSNAVLSQAVPATTWSFNHNLGVIYPVFQIYDSNNEVVIPETIKAVNTSSALIYFPTASTGYAIASVGGNIPDTASFALTSSVAISSSYALTASYAANVPATASYALQALSSSYSLTASYALNAGAGGISSIGIADEGTVQGTASFFDFVGAGVTTTVTNGTASINIPGGGGGSAVQGASTTFTQSVAATTWSFTHAINSRTPVVEVYDSSYNVIIPTRIYNPGPFNTNIYFDVAQSGSAIISTGGVLAVSGANAILNQSVAATTWSFQHDLQTTYPVFTIYDSNDDVIIPQRIHAVDSSSALIYFSSARTGKAVASVAGPVTFASSSLSASYAVSASYAFSSTSASYALSASYSVSSSYASQSLSSSYALTASFASSAASASNANDITVYVQNNTGVQIDRGSIVRISGAAGDNPLISLADWTNDQQSANTIGIVMSNIANGGNGYVLTEGRFIGYDTSTPGWTAGQLVFLGPSGSITGSAPQAPLHGVRLGQVLRVQQNNGSLYIRVDNGYELGELHDLVDTTTTASYGDLLVKSGSVWHNSKQLTGSYGLTGSLTATSFTGSLFGTASYALEALTSSNALTASTADNFIVRQNLTGSNALFSGTITAQTLNVQVITSSIEYVTGSTRFGSQLTDTHQFTGSVTITGSLSVNNSPVILTNQTSSMSVLSSSYALTASYALNGGGGGISAISIADEGTTQGTASYFDFTGAGVTATVLNGTASINVPGGGASTTGLTNTFTQSVAAATWTFIHSLNTKTPLVQVYDTSYNQITPQYISASNLTTVEIGFGVATAGYAVASTGGTLAVTGSNVILNQTVANTTWSFNHNLNTQYPIFQTFNASNEVMIPQRIVAVDNTSALIYFPVAVTGKAVASLGGISGSLGFGFPFSGSAVITGSFLVSQSFVDFTKATYVTGSFTGSFLGTGSFATSASYAVSASYATFALSASNAPGYTVNFTQSSAAATWSFVHNLNTRNPIVQVYDTSFKQILPNDIVATDHATVQVRFDYAQAGYAVASNGGGLYVTGSTSRLNQSVAAVTWSFTHNLNTRYPAFEVYDSTDSVIVPAGIKALTDNSSEIYFATPTTGTAIAQFSGINGAPNAVSASYAQTASYLNPITNSYVVLTQVSSSLNYADDTAAAAGGVPLGGLYRNGNFIMIRIV